LIISHLHKLVPVVVIAVVSSIAGPAFGQSDIRTETVHFQAGASGTTINGRITGRQSVSYVLGAKAGQRMRISLNADNTSTYFNVYQPERGPGDEALAVGDQPGPMMPDINQFDGTLPSSGNYIISVYLFRNAARDGKQSNYRLSIAIGDGGAAVTPQPGASDYADGNAGGPDFFEVANVPAGDMLNLRAGPDTHSQILARFTNGSVLANRGCVMQGSQRWCQVETADGSAIRGWVSGRYLTESAYTGSGGNDAVVAGTPYHATGPINCMIGGASVASECQFGVVRYGGGTADVVVTRPDATTVTIHFVDGEAVGYERHSRGPEGFSSQTVGNGVTIVTIGQDRYELVEAIMYGG
jgi:hypothetical protein